jgi:hypothetical protein
MGRVAKAKNITFTQINGEYRAELPEELGEREGDAIFKPSGGSSRRSEGVAKGGQLTYRMSLYPALGGSSARFGKHNEVSMG